MTTLTVKLLMAMCALLAGDDRRGATVAAEDGSGGARPAYTRASPRVYTLGYGSVDDDDDEPSIADTIRRPKEPTRWIGIRMAPVPAALAAHVGGEGLMVANVVKGSPADEAGLEQYDVIRRFGDAEIRSAEDLVAAVERAEKGSVRMVVIRGGKERSLSIRPAERPESGEVEYKYEEPADAVTDRSVELRGKMLVPGEDGEWILRDLGGLKGLPEAFDVLKDLHGWTFKLDPHKFDLDADGFHKFRIEPRIEIDTDVDDGKMQLELRIRKEEDGESVTIERDAEGKITVERTDKDGNTTTKTYENMDELREGDPDAAAMLGKSRVFIGGGSKHPFILDVPDIKHLPKLRLQWQHKIDETLDKVRKQLRDTRIRLKRFGADEDGGETHSRGLTVKIDDGKVVVITIENGETVKREFQSVDELKEDAPELYEELRELFEEDED